MGDKQFVAENDGGEGVRVREATESNYEWPELEA